MTTYNIVADGTSGYVGSVNSSTTTSYALAHTTPNNWSSSIQVGQDYGLGYYQVKAGYLRFDTSFLTAAATVTRAYLRLTAQTDASINDFNGEILKTDWVGTLSANRQTDFDLRLSGTKDVTWRNTSGMATNTPYNSPDLDTAHVSLTGWTYYILVSSLDRDAVPPPSGVGYLVLRLPADSTPDYRPQLIIEASYIPRILNLNPTHGIAGSSVTITGENFGASQGNGSVTFGGTSATVTDWQAGSITCEVPARSPGACTVLVTEDGGQVSAGESFTVDQTEFTKSTSDLIFLTDSFSVYRSITGVTDAVHVTDAVDVVSTLPVVTDTILLSDAVAVSRLLPTVADTITVTEAVGIGKTFELADTVAVTDAVAVEDLRDTADTVALADQVGITVYVERNDWVTLVDDVAVANDGRSIHGRGHGKRAVVRTSTGMAIDR